MAYTRSYSTTEERLKPTLQFYLYNDSYRWEFTTMVQNHSFEGDLNTANESFDISVWNRQESTDRRNLPFEEGLMVKVVLIYKQEKGQPSKPRELFRGVIVKRTLEADGKESMKVVDYNWYLNQNEVTKSFRKRRGDQIIKELCSLAGVPVGSFANTGYVFPEMEFIDKSIWSIMQTVLSETYLRTGKRYKISSEEGKLVLRELVVSLRRIMIERGANLLSSKRDISIEDVKTQVIMTGGENPKNPRQFKYDAALKKKYGTMTIIENDPDITGPGGLGTLANALLARLKKPSDQLSIEALADYTISAGTLIEVYDEFTGANNYYYVTSHNHSDANTMSLELSKTIDQELIRYEAPAEPKNTSSTQSTTVTGKASNLSYTSGYVATAYDPKLGGINGSGDYSTTASGTKWAYNRTIAVDPKVIPYGSVVHIYVPGFPQYSTVYLAEDTGGAIKGKRVDVLIKGKSATATFGRRNVQIAIIQKGKGRADARMKAMKWNSLKSGYLKKVNTTSTVKSTVKSGTRSKTKRYEVVTLAKSYKGKLKYKFGGKNIASGSGDCSGFTYLIYKKYGVNIGHGTSSQIGKGKKIAKSAAQPGDIVFFKGTYRAGVSHVGIVTGPGMCVSLASSGCKEHSYTSGYWGQHFMQINRVLDTELEDGSIVSPSWFR